MRRYGVIALVFAAIVWLGPLISWSASGDQLCTAIRNNNLQNVTDLIAAGADVNANTGSGEAWTPLVNAAYVGNVDIVRLLIDKGADVNGVCGDYSPLFRAACDNKLDVAKLLVEKGANVNFKNSKGETPLFTASSYGFAGVVQFLISSGADVNIAANNGSTALSEAQAGNPMDPESGPYTDVVSILRSAGAR
jgi:ankyrin repeat protein